jgi:predicted pyridoxine 5'-phosphate oxidase superfamily flavin-nucleotide-binding protein
MPLGPKLNRTLRAFIERQPMFFVATAAPEGRVNVSPKGADSLRILSDTRIQWLNLSGSGNETAGHVRLSDRMTLMFCAFEGDALILRVYGRAQVLYPRDAGWDEAAAQFPPMAGSRQIFDVTVEAA